MSTMLFAWSGAAVAQTAAHDPWARVPAMPTSYYSDDNFIDRVNQEYDAAVSDIEKQAKLNTEIKSKFDQMDATEKMKTMQAMQAAATTTSGGVTSANNTKLLQELAVHKTNFNAALDKTLKPLQARQEEMLK